MNRVKKKLNSESGLTLLLAIIFMLVSVTVSTVLLTMSLSSLHSTKSDREGQQAYLTVSSAVELMRDGLKSYEASHSDGTSLRGFAVDFDGSPTDIPTTVQVDPLSRFLNTQIRYAYSEQADDLFWVRIFARTPNLWKFGMIRDMVSEVGPDTSVSYARGSVDPENVESTLKEIASESMGFQEPTTNRSTSNFSSFFEKAIQTCYESGEYSLSGESFKLSMGELKDVYIQFHIKKVESSRDENDNEVTKYALTAVFSLSSNLQRLKSHDCVMTLKATMLETRSPENADFDWLDPQQYYNADNTRTYYLLMCKDYINWTSDEYEDGVADLFDDGRIYIVTTDAEGATIETTETGIEKGDASRNETEAENAEG